MSPSQRGSRKLSLLKMGLHAFLVIFSILLFGSVLWMHHIVTVPCVVLSQSIDIQREVKVEFSWLQPKHKLLVVIPGHGHPERLHQLKVSLEALQDCVAQTTIGFQCVVYVWNKEVLEKTSQEIKFCSIKYSSGFWTNHMLKVENPPAVDIHGESATHVLVMLDDMDARHVNLPELLKTMTFSNFDVVSPAIPNWQTASSKPRENCMAHRTDHVDILFTIFTSEMWSCWQHQISLDLNHFGWGYDLTFADICKAIIGVVDHEVAFHNPVCPEHGNDCDIRTYNETFARKQMDQWVMTAIGLNTEEEADQYFHMVAFERPKKFDYCQSIMLHLSSERYHQTTSHRGGWKSVIQYMNRAGYLSLDSAPVFSSSHNHTGTVELVDCIEEWFLWEKRGIISKPWIGFSHLLMKKDLPTHLAENQIEILDTYFDLEDFRQSAPNLICLILSCHIQLKGKLS